MDYTWGDIERQENGHRSESLDFIPGIDFDFTDPDEVEHVVLASQRSAAERIRHLEEENAQLRRALAKANK